MDTTDTPARLGDGVYYHGTMVSEHGLFTVSGIHDSGRYVLSTPDRESVLYHVRRQSFEVLISAEVNQ